MFGQDKHVCLWFDEDGAMIGTYIGHDGSVNTADVTCGKRCLLQTAGNEICVSGDSARLLTASSDSSVRLWDVQTGKSLFQWKVNEQCRACSLAVGLSLSFAFCPYSDVPGDRMAAFTTDRFMEHEPRLHIIEIEEDQEDQTNDLKNSVGFDARINRIKWAEQNTVLIAAHDDGFIRKWDAEVQYSQSNRCEFLCF